MPSPSAFKKGVGLADGSTFGSFEVVSCTCGHEMVRQNELYRFPLEILLRMAPKKRARQRDPHAAREQPTEKGALGALKKHLSGSRLIYSEYGSPYDCTVGPLHERRDAQEGLLAFTATGKAVRNRELPTLAQQHAEGEGDGVTDDELQHLRATHRVIKSHFSTSKCASCGSVIRVGEHIAQRKSDAGKRGGWTHARCAVEKAAAGAASSRSSKAGMEAEKRATGAQAKEGSLPRAHGGSPGAGGDAMGSGKKGVPAVREVGAKRRRSQLDS